MLSLSELVGRILEVHPTKKTLMPHLDDATSPRSMSLQPLVHVEEMASAVDFYEALGGAVVHGSRDGDFVLMQVGGSQLGLLAHPPNPEQDEGVVVLNFENGERLDDLEQRLGNADVTIAQSTTDDRRGVRTTAPAPDP